MRDVRKSRIVSRKKFEGTNRERLELDCGHFQEQAPRPVQRRRAVCLTCGTEEEKLA